MIVKNEEQTLGRCLDSIKDIVDEIIIIDTGSNDKTKDVASRYTDKIFDFEWIDDFSAARNYSFSKAEKEYILWLDADDVLLEEDRQRFKNLKLTLDTEVDVVMMKYNIGNSGSTKPVCTFYRERLLKRSKNFRWFDPVHEYIDFSGKIYNSDIAVTHKRLHPLNDRNLSIFKKMLDEGRELNKRQYFYYARESFLNGRIEDAITYYEKFLNTEGGLLSNYIDASIDLSRCYLSKEDTKRSLKALLKSFEHEPPRAEVCCQIGYLYKSSDDFKRAIAWFELATCLRKPEITWGSITHDCWGYIPYMELCSCNYKLGNIREALKSVEKALEFKPGDPSAIHNINFLNEVVKNVKLI